MTIIGSLGGLLDESVRNVVGSVPGATFIPRRHQDRPRSKYGRRGIYVEMHPIKGLTPAGVFPKGKPFAFQCPPMDTFGEDGSHAFTDYNVLSKTQHSQAVGKQLRTVQFQTIFLDWEPIWAVARDGSGTYPAQQSVKDLCAIRDHGKPFHLRAHQSNFQDKYDVDYAATLRSVSWNMQEPDCYYVTVQFSEFSSPDIQEFLAGSTTHPHLPASLVVARLPTATNTLAKMAKVYYGDPSKWKVIAAKNGLTSVSANTTLSKRNVQSTRITVPALRAATKARGQHR